MKNAKRTDNDRTNRSVMKIDIESIYRVARNGLKNSVLSI